MRRARRSQISGEQQRAFRALAQASSLWRARRIDESLRAYGDAAREFRWEPGVLLEAARAFTLRHRLGRAEGLLERALQIAARRAEVQCFAGEIYRMQGRFDAAEACFRQALGLAESAPRAELELAFVCERTGRLDEARQLCDRMLRREPGCAPAIVLQGRILRRMRLWDECEQLLTQHLPKDSRSSLTAEGWGELASLYDEMGRYDEAWQTIERCKQIQLQQDAAEWHAAQHVAHRFGQMVDDLTEAHLARWRQSPSHLGDFAGITLLAGFPRSGTTLIERVLDAHPQVASLEEKDILAAEVFPSLSRESHLTPVVSLLDGLDPKELHTACHLYCDRAAEALRGEARGQVLLDKNPALTRFIPIMLRLFPAARLLIALRDPRDVVVSCYLRYLPLNPVSVSFLTLERAVQRYQDDLQAWLRFREWMDSGWYEVRYEEVVTDLPREAHRCLDCMGLAWDDAVMDYRDQLTRRAVMSPTYDVVSRPVYDTAMGRWRHYERQLAPYLEALSATAEQLGYPAH